MTAGNCKISVTLICRCHFVLTLYNNSTGNSPGIRPIQCVSKSPTILSGYSFKNFGNGKNRNYLEIILGNTKRESSWNVRDFSVLSFSSQVQETESVQKRLFTLMCLSPCTFPLCLPLCVAFSGRKEYLFKVKSTLQI